ncbi:MAG: DUF4394 domain-containing protein [Rhodanobacteraceae bacterium]|nr:DUF4394 domain-containing protein [Rhodanobacteraceae bacterium]
MPMNGRSIFVHLLCLCALPVSAFAQVSVSQEAAGIGDANVRIANPPTTRTAAALLGGVPAGGLLLIPDSTNKRVMAFDPANGDLIDANFVPADDTHLSTPIEALASPDGSRLYVSDQIDDVVQAFDMASGAWVSTFAPAGGVNTAILDNIRGIGYRPNGNLLVSVGGGANTNTVAEFDGGGSYIGSFIAAGAGGVSSPFDVHSVGAAAGVLAAGDFLVPGSSSSAVHRYNSSGVAQANFAAVSTFPEQVARAANGNVLVANFSGAEGIFEFTPAGALVASYDPPGLGGYRGVHELPNGNLLVTTGTGVHEITRGAALVRSVVTGVSGRFISRVVPAGVETVYAITGAVAGVGLISFPANAPGTVTNIGALTGIVAGHSVRAIDFRPANGQLYALSTNGTAYQLYTVNLTTAALTPVGAAGVVAPAFPARVSIDFNPVVDRIRVVTGGAASYRINPNDGTLSGTDTNLAYVAGDPNAGTNPPFPIGVAYDRNDNDPLTLTTFVHLGLQ